MTTVPNVDSTQEFKVQSNNLSAEWGRFGGGVINVSIRSGANQPHGQRGRHRTLGGDTRIVAELAAVG
jgi:hypothetical protein